MSFSEYHVTPLIKYVETRFSRPIHELDKWIRLPEEPAGIPDGSTVVIVGGGLAGSSFARQLLLLCQKEKKSLDVYLVNSTGCNYCGGLVTNIALESMQWLYKLTMTERTKLEEIQACVYVNKKGCVQIEVPQALTSTLRTSRFGIKGFDDSFKDRIMEGIDDFKGSFTIIEPTVAKHIIPPKDMTSGRWVVVLSRLKPDGSNESLEADLVILATGFNSLDKPMLTRFINSTGFNPPTIFNASVTEIDTSAARINKVGRKVYMIDGVIPKAMLAFIPKGQNWLTLTALNKNLTEDDLVALFAHPVIKKIIDLPDPIRCLRCHTICPAFVYTAPSKNFYGDGWVTLGDLSGYGRVLKDGYFAVFIGSWLAAQTVVYFGTKMKDFKRYYHRPLELLFKRENRLGILLFNFNNFMGRFECFNRLLLAAARAERAKNSYGWAIHAAFRGLKTGLLPYPLITTLFILGILKYTLTRPWQTFKAVFNLNKSS